jgi:hypothetical protein
MQEPRLIEFIYNELQEVKKDVKSLLHFKWQVIGIAVATSSIVSGIVSLIFMYMELKK